MSPINKWRRTALSNKLNVILTAIICFMTVLNFVNTIVQSQSQSAQATALTVAVNAVKEALSTGTEQTKKGVEAAINTGSEHLQTTLDANQSAFSQMMKQNEGSLKASIAQGKEGLDASIKMSRQDQRPWITYARFELSAELEKDKEFSVKLWLQNTGKTPAINESSQSRLFLSYAIPQMTVFTKAQTIGSRSVSILAPGSASVFSNTAKWTPPDDYVVAYKEKQARLFIHGKVWYTDNFGKQHWITLCASHGFSEPLGDFEYCAVGNEVDPDQ